MKVLSLFDGISCARVALDRAKINVEAYYASEIDKYAIAISKKNWPEIIQIGSVTDIYVEKGFLHNDSMDGFEHIAYVKNSVDLLIGGSPCQDLSIAKKDRKGLDGERSGLFWEYVRILKEVKPKYFILENVASMPKEAKELITKTLGVEPIMIDAGLVSAQNRKRLFWTNIPGVILPEDRGILLRDILEPKVDDNFIVRPKSNTIRTSGRGSGIDDKHNWDTIRIGQIGNGGQGDRIYSPNGKSVALTETRTEEAKKIRKEYRQKYGKDFSPRREKELVPRKDEKANTITTGQTKESLVCIVPEATKKGYAIAQDGDSIDLSFPTSKTRRGRVGNKVKNLMTSQNIGVFTQGEIRKLTPTECERLQGLPDNYTEGISNTQRYKCLGNAFNADVIAHILSFIPSK